MKKQNLQTPEYINRVLRTSILSHVNKPGRYLGNELNVITKEWNDSRTSICLAFPDLYDTGMPYNGFQILYHILNREDYILAERVYAPWSDMDDQLREKKLSLFSLESKHSLLDFDIIGFTLPYDLLYTNILNMMDLAGIPLWQKDRGDEHPFIIAGGTNAYNTEPMADFFDAVVIGDGEDIIVRVVEIIGNGRREKKSRNAILEALAAIPEGVYIPSFYTASTDDALAQPINPIAPAEIKAIRIPYLKKENYPVKPYMPLVDVAMDRFSVEIMRGCTQGCRFCHAGMVYRPVRERTPEDVIAQTKETVLATGYEEITFQSLSTSDYTGLGETMDGLKSFLNDRNVSVAFPSMRVDSFTKEIADAGGEGRKSGLTFAPEAGTWRLRRVINKLISDEDLWNSVQIALDGGWKTLKFYFMLGLPTETSEDLDGIIAMIQRVRGMGKGYGGVNINVTMSTFIPKVFTPFQWETQFDTQIMNEKLHYLLHELKQIRNVKVSYRDPKYSELEGIFSRGDRNLAKVVHRAWELGAKFDSWHEHFNYDIWTQAFQECGVDKSVYLKSRDLEKPLPWDHVDTSLLKKFLKRERTKAYQEAVVIDCRDGCHACGVCDFDELTMRVHDQGTTISSVDPDFKINRFLKENVVGDEQTEKTYENIYTARIIFAKEEDGCFLGNLDVMKALSRAIHSASLPVKFTEGFNKKPKLSMGLALPLGYVSHAEMVDIQFYGKIEDLIPKMNGHLPRGLSLKHVDWVEGSHSAPAKGINALIHRIKFEEDYSLSSLVTLKKDFESKEKIIISRTRKGKTFELDIKDYIRNIQVAEREIRVETGVFENGQSIRINEFLFPFLNLDTSQHIPPHIVERLKAIKEK